ncbi:TlpA family protein disulfide reductase [Halosquirtibacter laminarini]|uniref:TlpA family protein disulfide reductase n=1 Tax=Halosquirtibacter laminarini TaxID=3374600 RepID=A0AC61NCL5_9BACT|nr:TlpA family protein disulfide reductase [Prolixibacteraceae bacterium]
MRLKFILIVGMLFYTMSQGSLKAQKRIDAGQKIENIVLKDTKREKRSITELQGKVVLIHFWASWCPNCRIENKKLIELYEKYKDRDFTQGQKFEIYAISLDKKEQQWLKAIEHDGISWKYNVSDLKGWYGKYPTRFQLQYVPYNILINKNGTIIANNLKFKELQSRLINMSK